MISSYVLQILAVVFTVLIVSIQTLPLDCRPPSAIKTGSQQSTKGYNDNNEQHEHIGKAPIKIICKVNGYSVPAIIDTGSEITVMSTSCARMCRIYNNIDTRYAGRAIGVGSSAILGRVNGLKLKVGPATFSSRVAVLQDCKADFLIGRDLLRRFKFSLSDDDLQLNIKERMIRIPVFTDDSAMSRAVDEFNNEEDNEDNMNDGNDEEFMENENEFDEYDEYDDSVADEKKNPFSHDGLRNRYKMSMEGV